MKKYKQIKVNLDESDFCYHKRKSEQLNISMSEYVRQHLDAKIDDVRTPKKSYKKYIATDPNLLYEINKIGNNLNQIARKINQGESLDLFILLTNIEQKLNELI
jgi:vacuolar-type H+-ATPase subunit I/STV1